MPLPAFVLVLVFLAAFVSPRTVLCLVLLLFALLEMTPGCFPRGLSLSQGTSACGEADAACGEACGSACRDACSGEAAAACGEACGGAYPGAVDFAAGTAAGRGFDACAPVEASSAELAGDEHNVYQALFRGDGTREAAGALGLSRRLTEQLRESLEEAEGRVWWGRHET